MAVLTSSSAVAISVLPNWTHIRHHQPKMLWHQRQIGKRLPCLRFVWLTPTLGCIRKGAKHVLHEFWPQLGKGYLMAKLEKRAFSF
jgi:hypothetical protein